MACLFAHCACHHVRVFRYPHGIFALRILGLLGGRNRAFLRADLPGGLPLGTLDSDGGEGYSGGGRGSEDEDGDGASSLAVELEWAVSSSGDPASPSLSSSSSSPSSSSPSASCVVPLGRTLASVVGLLERLTRFGGVSVASWAPPDLLREALREDPTLAGAATGFGAGLTAVGLARDTGSRGQLLVPGGLFDASSEAGVPVNVDDDEEGEGGIVGAVGIAGVGCGGGSGGGSGGGRASLDPRPAMAVTLLEHKRAALRAVVSILASLLETTPTATPEQGKAKVQVSAAALAGCGGGAVCTTIGPAPQSDDADTLAALLRTSSTFSSSSTASSAATPGGAGGASHGSSALKQCLRGLVLAAADVDLGSEAGELLAGCCVHFAQVLASHTTLAPNGSPRGRQSVGCGDGGESDDGDEDEDGADCGEGSSDDVGPDDANADDADDADDAAGRFWRFWPRGVPRVALAPSASFETSAGGSALDPRALVAVLMEGLSCGHAARAAASLAGLEAFLAACRDVDAGPLGSSGLFAPLGVCEVFSHLCGLCRRPEPRCQNAACGAVARLSGASSRLGLGPWLTAWEQPLLEALLELLVGCPRDGALRLAESVCGALRGLFAAVHGPPHGPSRPHAAQSHAQGHSTAADKRGGSDLADRAASASQSSSRRALRSAVRSLVAVLTSPAAAARLGAKRALTDLALVVHGPSAAHANSSGSGGGGEEEDDDDDDDRGDRNDAAGGGGGGGDGRLGRAGRTSLGPSPHRHSGHSGHSGGSGGGGGGGASSPHRRGTIAAASDSDAEGPLALVTALLLPHRKFVSRTLLQGTAATVTSAAAATAAATAEEWAAADDAQHAASIVARLDALAFVVGLPPVSSAAADTAGKASSADPAFHKGGGDAGKGSSEDPAAAAPGKKRGRCEASATEVSAAALATTASSPVSMGAAAIAAAAAAAAVALPILPVGREVVQVLAAATALIEAELAAAAAAAAAIAAAAGAGAAAHASEAAAAAPSAGSSVSGSSGSSATAALTGVGAGPGELACLQPFLSTDLLALAGLARPKARDLLLLAACRACHAGIVAGGAAFASGGEWAVARAGVVGGFFKLVTNARPFSMGGGGHASEVRLYLHTSECENHLDPLLFAFCISSLPLPARVCACARWWWRRRSRR